MFLPELAFEAVNFSQPSLIVVKLNSDQARQWLAQNTNNRRIRKSLVAYLRRQIDNGEWQDSHPQPIVFSSAGRLLDGQHRLMAIAESDFANGHGVRLRVETGASDLVREYLDTGIPRTLEDRVELYQDPLVNKFAAQIVAIYVMLYQPGARSFKKATPEDAKDFVDIHRDAILWASEIHRRDRGVGLISVAYAAVEYRELAPTWADEFYRDLFIPAGDCQQAQMLRDWLQRRAVRSSGDANRREAYAKAVGAMKAHLEGREIKRILRASSWQQ